MPKQVRDGTRSNSVPARKPGAFFEGDIRSHYPEAGEPPVELADSGRFLIGTGVGIRAFRGTIKMFFSHVEQQELGQEILGGLERERSEV
jgi:hypothetical protein